MPLTQKAVRSVPILGSHPSDGLLHHLFLAADALTVGKTAHRTLSERPAAATGAVSALKARLVEHHASVDAIARSKVAIEACRRQGVPIPKALRRFPANPDTQKGNFAEVLLAEYVTSSTTARLPVFRLRHNPNVDQSMKGDDVLAFDLDATPVRIIVGEAKFRSASTNTIANTIMDTLASSLAGGLPASLQFVADHVDPAVGARVMGCAELFAEGRLGLDYVGLLMSDRRAHERVATCDRTSPKRTMLLSVAMDNPAALVDACFGGLF